jgi:hypothetical protein
MVSGVSIMPVVTKKHQKSIILLQGLKTFITFAAFKDRMIIDIMNKNNLHKIDFESFAGNFFGFWFYFFYTLKSFRDQ